MAAVAAQHPVPGEGQGQGQGQRQSGCARVMPWWWAWRNARDPPGTMALINWKQLFNRVKPSVFLVVFTPKRAWRKNFKDLIGKANSKTDEELQAILDNSEWAAETGIASRMEDDRYLYITTCAHIVDYFFHGLNAPITPKMLNKLFKVEVLCYHAEVDFLVDRMGDGQRTYTPAVICGIDCSKDLIMLRVDLHELALRGVGQEDKVLCEEVHPVMTFNAANEFGQQCMLVSWPEFRSCSFAEGTQCQHRRRNDMATNPVGYNMNLLEAYIGTEGGSSGAPLLNAIGEVKGILHGGQGGPHSQFILSSYITPFIQNNAVPPDSPPTPSSSSSSSSSSSDNQDPPPSGRKRNPSKGDKTSSLGRFKRGRLDSQGKTKTVASGGSTRRTYELRSRG